MKWQLQGGSYSFVGPTSPELPSLPIFLRQYLYTCTHIFTTFLIIIFFMYFVDTGKCANDGRTPEHEKNSKRQTWLSLRVSEGLLEEGTKPKPEGWVGKGGKVRVFEWGEGPGARGSLAVQATHMVWHDWGRDDGGWWTWPRLQTTLSAVEVLYMATCLVYFKRQGMQWTNHTQQ